MVETHSKLSATAVRAMSYYNSGIKDELTEDDNGRYVVIDANSGEWMLGNAVEVVFDMRDRMPDSHPVVIQHPGVSPTRLSSRQSKTFE